MIIIRCPGCQELRVEDELTYGGETDVQRPLQPQNATDAEWTEYLFMRSNPRGPLCEQWCCSAGCGQWFTVRRDSVTHDVLGVARLNAVIGAV